MRKFSQILCWIWLVAAVPSPDPSCSADTLDGRYVCQVPVPPAPQDTQLKWILLFAGICVLAFIGMRGKSS